MSPADQYYKKCSLQNALYIHNICVYVQVYSIYLFLHVYTCVEKEIYPNTYKKIHIYVYILYVCVCVCIERERDRETETDRDTETNRHVYIYTCKKLLILKNTTAIMMIHYEVYSTNRNKIYENKSAKAKGR